MDYENGMGHGDMDYGKKKGGKKRGAKSSESATQEGLRNKSDFDAKGMYEPHEKSQRMPKGSDRIGGEK